MEEGPSLPTGVPLTMEPTLPISSSPSDSGLPSHAFPGTSPNPSQRSSPSAQEIHRKLMKQYIGNMAESGLVAKYSPRSLLQLLKLVLMVSSIVIAATLISNYAVFGYFTPYSFQMSAKPVAKVAVEICRNTEQGKVWITDDRGYVCKRQDINPMNKCCRPTTVQRYSCNTDYCNVSSNCCSMYEYCVSCCMNPANSEVKSQVLSSTENNLLKSTENEFDYCRAVCRTSSKSLMDQKNYRSDQKFCYGATAPPLQNETAASTEPKKEPFPYPISNDKLENSLEVRLDMDMLDPSVYIPSERSVGHSIHFNMANWLRITLLCILLYQMLPSKSYT